VETCFLESVDGGVEWADDLVTTIYPKCSSWAEVVLQVDNDKRLSRCSSPP